MVSGMVAFWGILALCVFAVQGYRDPYCIDNRDAIVHLFEWRWEDVAYECENFLGPMGFCAVQISPPNENRIVDGRPWWERYQPISYKLVTRSGDEAAFKDMVNRCNKAGVRIFADVVINHMCRGGGKGKGTAGTDFDADALQFPGVPFGPGDFNGADMCHTDDQWIHGYGNAEEVRNCRLENLLDLRMGTDYVRTKVAEYLNNLISLGVMGFRIDAVKHMWPGDLKALFEKVDNIAGSGRPFVYQEVIDKGGNEPIKGEQYLATGRITNFKVGIKLAEVFRKQNPMKYLANWGEPWGMWNTVDVVNFIDNHDNQREQHLEVLTHWEPRAYKAATAFMLAHPYGMPRIMSSYDYDRSNRNLGPPAFPGTIATKPVPHNGNLCGDGWVCEHRWRQIYEMVAFRNMAKGTGLDNWWSGRDYEIAFSRGDKAFIAFNFEDSELKTKLQTGLPAGKYCNIVTSVMKDKDTCVKEDDNEKGMNIVEVGGDGTAEIWVPNDTDDPFLAIHVGAKLGDEVKTHQ